MVGTSSFQGTETSNSMSSSHYPALGGCLLPHGDVQALQCLLRQLHTVVSLIAGVSRRGDSRSSRSQMLGGEGKMVVERPQEIIVSLELLQCCTTMLKGSPVGRLYFCPCAYLFEFILACCSV